VNVLRLPSIPPALVLAAIAAIAAIAAVGTPASAAPRPSWFWEWSDGSRSRDRVLSEDVHRTWSDVPSLVVASDPPWSGRPVRLEVLIDGRWRTEDASRTDQEGAARLRVNPYCSDGDWCSTPASYRLVVDGITARLAVSFQPT